MSAELEALERDLLVAANIWFNQHLQMKLQKLIAIAKAGEAAAARLEEVEAGAPEPTTPTEGFDA